MKECKFVQEKLVSGESLSPQQLDHLRLCPACGQMQETHCWLESKARLCRNLTPLAEKQPALGAKPERGKMRRLSWVLAVSTAAALAAAIFLRPEPDTGRVAEGLGALLEDVYQRTDSEAGREEFDFAGAGWLSLEWSSADPAGGQYDWL